MTDDPYNASERTDVREADKAARLAQRQDLDITRDIMRTAAGRQWMYRKLALCHVHATTFTGQALHSAFAEGERNIGLMLEAEILLACPDDFILMIKEANERDITGDITRRNRKRANGDDASNGGGNYVNYDERVDAAGDAEVERDA